MRARYTFVQIKYHQTYHTIVNLSVFACAWIHINNKCSCSSYLGFLLSFPTFVQFIFNYVSHSVTSKLLLRKSQIFSNQHYHFNKKKETKRKNWVCHSSSSFLKIGYVYPFGMVFFFFTTCNRVNYVQLVYLWCLELKCLSDSCLNASRCMSFVVVTAVSYGVYLFNFSYFVFLSQKKNCRQCFRKQINMNRQMMVLMMMICIVGCHHLCALINSWHFAINKIPKRIDWFGTVGVDHIPLRMVNQNWCPNSNDG